MNKNLTPLFIFALFTTGFTPTSEPVKVKLFAAREASTISYSGTHPFHSWKAVSRDINCVITFNELTRAVETVAASAKIMSFDSRNTNRDSHALEVLDALIYPKVNFTSSHITQKDNSLIINGNLNLHGITRPVVMQAKLISGSNENIRIEGSFPVKLIDHKVKPPALLGFRIAEEIVISFDFVFKQN